MVTSDQWQRGFANSGSPHQYQGQDQMPGGLIAPPTSLPGGEYTSMFMPDILSNPFVSGINSATQMGSFASQAAPAAGHFQQDLYNPNMNAMETNFLGASASQGLRGLNSAMNRIDSQYEGAPGHSARPQQYMDAANQFADSMLSTGSQMGLQRQQMATQNLGQAFGSPLQAISSAQESASGLNNLAQNAMYQDMQYPQAIWSGTPITTPTLVQSSGGGGGKK